MADAAQVAAFAALGVLSTTQQLAGACIESMEGADPDLVAEETLCFVATATARAAEVGLREKPDLAQRVVPTVLDLPYTYRDYLIGGAMIAGQDATLQEMHQQVYRRLQRKMEFYRVHLPAHQFPGERALTDKMELWMGRVSPPQLPELPSERLEKLDLLPLLLTHLKLVLAYGRQDDEERGKDEEGAVEK